MSTIQKLKEALQDVLNASDKYGQANEDAQSELPRDTVEFTEWANAYNKAKELLEELNNPSITVAHK